MDKKPNKIHENLILTKFNKHTVHTQQLVYFITGQPSYQVS